jgi:hypothetical protein
MLRPLSILPGPQWIREQTGYKASLDVVMQKIIPLQEIKFQSSRPYPVTLLAENAQGREGTISIGTSGQAFNPCPPNTKQEFQIIN